MKTSNYTLTYMYDFYKTLNPHNMKTNLLRLCAGFQIINLYWKACISIICLDSQRAYIYCVGKFVFALMKFSQRIKRERPVINGKKSTFYATIWRRNYCGRFEMVSYTLDIIWLVRQTTILYFNNRVSMNAIKYFWRESFWTSYLRSVYFVLVLKQNK